MALLLALFSGFGLALVAPWLHRRLGDRCGWAIALLPLGLAIFFGRELLRLPAGEQVVARYAWVPELGLSLSLHLDGLSLLFALLISSIGTLVMIYASGYLAGHRQLGVFYSYLLAFMGAMLGLVLAGNLLGLYVFWELTTLTSFLLIGFEHDREAARAAALQGLLVTALGGLAMLAGFVLLGLAGGSFEIADLLERGGTVRDHALYVPAVVLILLGAFTKSAQFPFHFWLPNAMQAPTPVSAYLHSATMVKAGVYLVARLSPVLGGTEVWSGAVTTVGAATMLLGAAVAFLQHDLKAILAYLTINVLGTLMMLLGLGTPLAVEAAMAYLVAHALYKGALFLVAGAVDHAAHTRDVRELSGLARRMPLTAGAAVLAALSMAGVLPFFGFVAKELYFEAAGGGTPLRIVLLAAAAVSSAFLVAGAGLVAVRPFFGHASAKSTHAHEADFALWLGPVLLAGAGLAAGLFPGLLVQPLAQPAIAAILGEPVAIEFALWHGVTVWFVLSTGVLAAGIALYVARQRVLTALPAVRGAAWWSPESWYHHTVAGMNRLARAQTRLLQSGYLRVYVAIILAATVILVSTMIAHMGLPFLRRAGVGMRIWEAIAAALILASTAVAVWSTSRFGAIAALGVIGFSVAWLFHLFGAPDLAMTQVVVEALTVVLFVLAFYHLPPYSLLSTRRTRIRDAALAASAGGLVTALLLLVTSFPPPERISDYYARNSVPLAHGANVVNVILVDFRALDTLGEITVLATAALGVASLLRFSLKGAGRP